MVNSQSEAPRWVHPQASFFEDEGPIGALGSGGGGLILVEPWDGGLGRGR